MRERSASLPREETRAAFGEGRITPQRAAIAYAAASMARAFTVDELAERVRDANPGVGVATVYRAVSAMEATGWLERVGERDGTALFVRCAEGEHHHHVVCTGCGRVEAARCPIPDLDTGAPSGFVVTRHDVTLYGLCPNCLGGTKA